MAKKIIQFNKTYHKDNLIMLKKFKKSGTKFDLILTDPPYNIGKSFGEDKDNMPLDAYLELSRIKLDLCKSILSPSGSIIWFCSHKYLGYLQCIMYDLELFYKRIIIWHYNNGMSGQSKTPVTEYEPILWFTKSEDSFIYNVDDVRVPYKSDRVKSPVYKKNSSGNKIAWTPNPMGAKRGDVWNYPILAGKLYAEERTKHPTQKPESLITDLLKAFSPKKNNKYYGNVLDIYHGSGTVGACCEKLNKQGNKLRWIGVEKDATWVEVANSRIEVIRNGKESTFSR